MITTTPKIEEKLKLFTKDEKNIILKEAWEYCCDGEWLEYNCGHLDYDPWDIVDSTESDEIEEDAVNAAILAENWK